MELEQFGFKDISLMNGERVDSSLRLAADGAGDSSIEPEVLLLTDRRVIHLQGNGKRRRAIFASIGNINAVEVSVAKDGNGTYVWAALALVVAVLLFIVIDNTIGRIVGPLVVALMGIYLIVDQRLSPGRPMLTFKAGSSELRVELKSEQASSDIYAFINRLFQLKEQRSHGNYYNSRPFAPH